MPEQDIALAADAFLISQNDMKKVLHYVADLESQANCK